MAPSRATPPDIPTPATSNTPNPTATTITTPSPKPTKPIAVEDSPLSAIKRRKVQTTLPGAPAKPQNRRNLTFSRSHRARHSGFRRTLLEPTPRLASKDGSGPSGFRSPKSRRAEPTSRHSSNSIRACLINKQSSYRKTLKHGAYHRSIFVNCRPTI